MRSCGSYKNHNQVLWHTLGQFPQSRLGRLHDCPRFQKVSANLTIFKFKVSAQFLVVAGPLPCWRSVIDTFLPTQSSSLIGQSLMLRPILNKFIIILITAGPRNNNHYNAHVRSPRQFESILNLYRTGQLHMMEGVCVEVIAIMNNITEKDFKKRVCEEEK